MTSILAAFVLATNWYHTSLFAVPSHAGNEGLATIKLPVSGTHDPSWFNILAVSQSSFTALGKEE